MKETTMPDDLEAIAKIEKTIDRPEGPKARPRWKGFKPRMNIVIYP